LKFSTQVKPISYLKSHAAEIVKNIAANREPMLIMGAIAAIPEPLGAAAGIPAIIDGARRTCAGGVDCPFTPIPPSSP